MWIDRQTDNEQTNIYTYIYRGVFCSTKFNDCDKKTQGFIYNQNRIFKNDRIANPFRIKKKLKETCRAKKKKNFQDYIEIILSPSRDYLCLQRDGLQDKIWIVSSIFKWNEECDFLDIENKSTLNFSAHSRLFTSCSAIDDLYVFLRLSVGPTLKFCIFIGTCSLFLSSSLWLVLPI